MYKSGQEMEEAEKEWDGVKSEIFWTFVSSCSLLKHPLKAFKTFSSKGQWRFLCQHF